MVILGFTSDLRVKGECVGENLEPGGFVSDTTGFHGEHSGL